MTPAHRLPPLKWRKEPGLLLTSYAQRKAVFGRDNGVCSCCGRRFTSLPTFTVLFEADHVQALHNLRPSIPFPEALKYWRIGNLQTLCPGCHKTKSARELTANAKVKRIRARIEGTRKPRKRLPTRRRSSAPRKFKPTKTKFINVSGGTP